MAQSKSDIFIRITTDTPYFALTGELRGVYGEDFEENRPRYNGTALYFALQVRQAWAVWDHRWLAGSEQLLEQSQCSY